MEFCMNSLNNFRDVKPENRLYTLSESLKMGPAVNERCVINMISISTLTTQTDFENAWKKNPGYKLDMRGPCDSSCRGGTVLHRAVCENNLEMTKYIIKKLDRKIDLLNILNITPLQLAIHNLELFGGNLQLEIINELLKAGADVNLANEDCFDYTQSSMLGFALRNLELTKLLLQYGAQKLHAFAPDRKSIIKEKFNDVENKIYKQAKREVRYPHTLFILGFQDPNSLIYFFPKEIIAHIVTCAKVESSHQQRINQAKKELSNFI